MTIPKISAQDIARAGAGGETVVVTADPEVVRTADRVVLPGVGAFADCRAGLDAVPGMVEAMTEADETLPHALYGALAKRRRQNDCDFDLAYTQEY